MSGTKGSTTNLTTASQLRSQLKLLNMSTLLSKRWLTNSSGLKLLLSKTKAKSSTLSPNGLNQELSVTQSLTFLASKKMSNSNTQFKTLTTCSWATAPKKLDALLRWMPTNSSLDPMWRTLKNILRKLTLKWSKICIKTGRTKWKTKRKTFKRWNNLSSRRPELDTLLSAAMLSASINAPKPSRISEVWTLAAAQQLLPSLETQEISVCEC